MKTIEQTRTVKEVHVESIDYIRLSDSIVIAMLTSKVNNKKPKC